MAGEGRLAGVEAAGQDAGLQVERGSTVSELPSRLPSPQDGPKLNQAAAAADHHKQGVREYPRRSPAARGPDVASGHKARAQVEDHLGSCADAACQVQAEASKFGEIV